MASPTTTSPSTRANEHGWFGTETVRTRAGKFAFRHSYPDHDASHRLRDALSFHRAVEAYLAQMHSVGFYHLWSGIGEWGAATPNQVVLWEDLMDGETLLLTGNCETVYGFSAIDLKRDGPVVIEAPAGLLGSIMDLWQQPVMDIGTTGRDKGQGGRFLVLPPDHEGDVPDGYMTGTSRTYRVVLGVRGFQSNEGTAPTVALMRSMKVYPLSRSANPRETTFVDGSHQEIDTIFPDTGQFFVDLATMIETEPRDVIPPHERFQLAAIGIEKGKPFTPDATRQALFDDAARFGAAIARANTFDSDDPARLVYPDRRWETLFIGGSATFDSQGYVNIDRRAAFAYIAIGMTPATIDKHVGAGSQYIWTARDASGAFLDGGNRYRLHVPPNVPAKNFWSVVAYDADSRSILRSDQRFPTISTYTHPRTNADGSIDILFGPDAPRDSDANWIQTVPGKGWFVLFRFYGPLEPFFDRSWKPNDIEEVG